MSKPILSLLTAALLIGNHLSADSVALRLNKPTDGSVCDLAPQTSDYIGEAVLLPAAAKPSDKEEMIFRYAGRFVVDNCRDGQVLILHGNPRFGGDTAAMERLANSMCLAASIRKVEVPYQLTRKADPGLEYRCPISKMNEFRRQLTVRERQDPMEALKQRLYTQPGAPARVGWPGQNNNQAGGRDCSKLSLASIMMGGGSDCR